MSDDAQLQTITFGEGAIGTDFDNCVIQSLNRWVPDKAHGHYLVLDAFKENASAWDGVPVVFAERHPDVDLFATDPEKALALVGGREVGRLSNSRVVETGTPRVMSAIKNVTDAEVLELYNQGQLSLSTGLKALISQSTRHVLGNVRPNHVLLFKVDEAHGPKDLGVLINQETETMVEPTQTAQAGEKSVLDKIFEKLENLSAKPEIIPVQETPKMEDAKVTELTNKLETSDKELAAKVETIKNMDETIKARDATIAELTNQVKTATDKLTAFENKEKDAKFEKFLNMFPKGIKENAEKTKELRATFDSDPLAFAEKVAETITNMSKVDETKEVGKTETLKNGTAPSKGLGVFDILKGEYKDV